MNKMIYVGVAIVVIIVIMAAVAFSYPGSKSTSTTSAASTVVTVPSLRSTSTVNATTTTANTTLSACSAYPGYVCPTTTCTATNSIFTCTNATYLYSSSNGLSDLIVTLGQKTGQEWSSFGVGYAPAGTKMTSGIPQITWYTANYSSKSNVGTSLQSGQTVLVKPDNAESGNGLNATTTGTIWACFVNSGLVYVGSSCQPNGGGSAAATYVRIANITTT